MSNAVSIAQSGANNVTMRNRVINGQMQVDQRNAGVVSMPAGSIANSFASDRWNAIKGTPGALTIQKSSVAPAGYANSLLVTVVTSYTPAATDYSAIRQGIEGLNVADLGWGTASAQTVTLSFWIRCSVAGTYNWSFLNSAENRGYVSSFVISAANTWEYKTLTVPGDTSGTWLTDTGNGIRLLIDLGTGSTYSTTAGSWQTFNFAYGLTGGTKLISNSGATMYFTGVQLEKGTTATPFEQRLYGTELALCQRYFYNLGGESVYQLYATGQAYSTTQANSLTIPYPVTMRASPTFSYSALADFRLQTAAGSSATLTSITQNADEVSQKMACLRGTVASGLVAGNATSIFSNNTTAARLNWTAEL